MKTESNRKDAKDAKKNKRFFWIILCAHCAFAVNDFKYLQGAPCEPGLYRRDAEDTGKIMETESNRRAAEDAEKILENLTAKTPSSQRKIKYSLESRAN